MTGQAPQGDGAAPVCEYTQEVRFAVVLYGGVSLAIYINGITAELLRLVRATAPADPSSQLDRGTTPAWLPPGQLRSTEVVYRRLGQMLGVDGLRVDAGASSPLRTRFVVDILSGSSAGGINAIVLGKALASELPDMNRVRDLWISEGDIAALVNDRRSLDGIEGLTLEHPLPSVLNSQRMYCKLLSAFDAMDDDAATVAHHPCGDSRLVDELDCWITTTDLHGLQVTVKLADEVVEELHYRNVYRFLYRASNTSGDGAVETDFTRQVNPFLAFAARCTSSFPGAFAPIRLQDTDAMVALPEFRAEYTGPGVPAGNWSRYFPDYRNQEAPPYCVRSFADGGILDNKPFTWATGTLALRRADVAVDRRLVYLEPSPDAVGPVSSERPDMVQTVGAAFTLPRQQTIREQIAELRRRNAQIERLQDALLVLDLNPQTVTGVRVQAFDYARWIATPLRDLITARGLAWAAYHRMHVASVLDDMAETVVRVLDFDRESDSVTAVRALAQAWFEQTYESETDESRLPQSAFLSEFSLGYRLRRLHFLNRRIDRMVRLDADALRGLARPRVDVDLGGDGEAQFRDELWRCKRLLNDNLPRLRAAGRSLRRDGELREVVARLGFASSRALVDGVVAGTATPEQARQRARALVAQRNLLAPLQGVADTIAGGLRPAFLQAAQHVDTVLDAGTAPTAAARAARTLLRSYHDDYEAYDVVILPVNLGDVGEAGYVEVIRISPDCARMLLDQGATGHHKLGGDQYGHFGGFFWDRWRRNDMMWGRLDAAERLISTLVPPTDPPQVRAAAVDELVRQAHDIILEEERAQVFTSPQEQARSLDELRAYIAKDYTAPTDVPEKPLHDSVRRALSATARVMQGIGDRPGTGRPVRRLAGMAVQAVLTLARRSLEPSAYVVAAACVLVSAVLLGIGLAAHVAWLTVASVVLLSLFVLGLGAMVGLGIAIRRALTPKKLSEP